MMTGRMTGSGYNFREGEKEFVEEYVSWYDPVIERLGLFIEGVKGRVKRSFLIRKIAEFYGDENQPNERIADHKTGEEK